MPHARRAPVVLSLFGLALAAASPASAQQERGGPVRVCVGGDVTLGTNLDTTWAAVASRHARRPVRALPDPRRLVAPLEPLLADAAVVLVNVEGAIGDGPAPPKCPPDAHGCFALRQPPAAAQAIRSLSRDGEVVGNLANNHARDAGVEGLRETETRLAAAGVHVTGADTLPTLVVTPRGDTVAILGFGTGSGPDSRDLDAVRRHVARAAAAYPRLVVTMHIGAEGRTALRTRDTMELYLNEKRGNPVAFAHAVVEAGARLVVGHGPHVLRGVEWRDGALIAYSLGNLVTYGPFSLRPPLDRGGILCASLDDSGHVTDAVLRPTRLLPPGWVSGDRGARTLAMVDSLSRLDFPRSAATFVIEGAIGRPRRKGRR